jgi:hypothetical protein
MDIQPQRNESTPREPENRRKHHRLKVLWWGQIDLGAKRLSCSVFDLSPGGARVRFAHAFSQQQPARLAMPPFGEFEGEVVWVEDGLAGIRFAEAERDRVARIIACRLNEAPQ